MNLEDLATLILNIRVGRSDRGWKTQPTLEEQFNVKPTENERRHFNTFSGALMKEDESSVDSCKLREEIFSILADVIRE